MKKLALVFLLFPSAAVAQQASSPSLDIVIHLTPQEAQIEYNLIQQGAKALEDKLQGAANDAALKAQLALRPAAPSKKENTKK